MKLRGDTWQEFRGYTDKEDIPEGKWFSGQISMANMAEFTPDLRTLLPWTNKPLVNRMASRNGGRHTSVILRQEVEERGQRYIGYIAQLSPFSENKTRENRENRKTAIVRYYPAVLMRSWRNRSVLSYNADGNVQ